MKVSIEINITASVRTALSEYIRFLYQEWNTDLNTIWQEFVLSRGGVLHGYRKSSDNWYHVVVSDQLTAKVSFDGRRHSFCDLLKRHWGVTLSDIYHIDVAETSDPSRCPLDVWEEV